MSIQLDSIVKVSIPQVLYKGNLETGFQPIELEPIVIVGRVVGIRDTLIGNGMYLERLVQASGIRDTNSCREYCVHIEDADEFHLYQDMWHQNACVELKESN